MGKLKVVFMGNTSLSSFVLEKLLKEKNIEVIKVVVNNQNEDKIPTLKLTSKYNLEVLKTKKIKEQIKVFENLGHDLIITCAFGQILPLKLLNTSKIGNLNIHTSILPKYRGASPIQHALFNLDKKTGVSIIEMLPKMDAGDVYALEKININKEDNYDSLENKMKDPASKALFRAISLYTNGEKPLFSQNEEEVSFAPILKRKDEKIDLENKGEQIEGKIRGLSEKPGAYLYLENKQLKILEAYFNKKDYKGVLGEVICKDRESFSIKVKGGVIKVFRLQLEGKKKLYSRDFLNGYTKIVGKVLK